MMSPPPGPTPAPKLSAFLASNTPIPLDGALATYLETLGADISGALWSAHLLTTQPTLITKAHHDYFKAGAAVAITASYQASIPGLVKQLRISDVEARGLVTKSVQLAQEARKEFLSSPAGQQRGDAAATAGGGGGLYIAGSIGPYATFLADGSEYRGDYNIPHSDMKAFHRDRVSALVSAGIDILACETMPSYPELRALAELLQDEFPQTEAWFTFTLRDEKRISDGTPLVEVVKVLEQCGNAVAVGVNCVQQDVALAALHELKSLTSKPLVVYPNSGEVWNHAKRDWEGSRMVGMGWAERTRQYWDAGAKLIGGCCRTTPDDIKVIAETLRDIQKP